MKDQVASRKQAYSFTVRKIKEPNLASNHRFRKETELTDYISINDFVELKECIGDPSQQLTANLKHLLKGVTNETEIDQYLALPFINRNLDNTNNSIT